MARVPIVATIARFAALDGLRFYLVGSGACYAVA
jgi:hypothetical protein